MNNSKPFEQDGFIFEIDSNKSDAVTILNHTGVWGHFSKYFNNVPVIFNENVIYIPESATDPTGKKYTVISIGRGVFDSLTKVEEIYIPASIEMIYWSFWLCHKLKQIHIDPKNKYYKDIDGVLYSKDLKRLIVFPCDYANYYKVLDGVTQIGNMAFKNSHSIEKIEFPKSLKKIGTNVFYDCVKLEHVHGIPDNLRTFELNLSSKPIKAIFNFRNREWTMQEIVYEFNKDNPNLLKCLNGFG